jgi:hypothetical protein
VVAIVSLAVGVFYAIIGAEVRAQDAIKIGLSAPLTGPFRRERQANDRSREAVHGAQ